MILQRRIAMLLLCFAAFMAVGQAAEKKAPRRKAASKSAVTTKSATTTKKAAATKSAAAATTAPLYGEALRPQFHFSGKKNWLNDPNGLVYYKGTWHLFFQYAPTNMGGDKYWGHATSTDLVRWKELPLALTPDENGTNWSGSAVVDWNNTSGLQSGEEKPLVAFYTGAPSKSWGAGKKFTQCLAYSTDGGKTWKKYEKNPVVEHIAGSNRDPRVFWHELSQQWIMVLYLDNFDFAFLGSKNLKEWTRLSQWTMQGSRECPEFFEMAVDGDKNNKKWVFYAGNGAYTVGSFDGTRFTSETATRKQDWGRNWYASQTYSDVPESDGRRIQIAWMNGGKYPGMPFNQQMSFPCELKLIKTDDGLRLTRTPVREIEKLRARPAVEKADIELKPGEQTVGRLGGNLLDIRAQFEVGGAQEVGLIVSGEKVSYKVKEGKLTCLGGTAPLEAKNGKIELQVLADRTSLEVFGDGGLASISACFLPQKGAKGVEPYAVGGAARLVSLKVYELRSAWQAVADYESAIKAFEKDAATRERGGIVFLGSSTFTQWKSLEQDMAPLPVINRGFGGSQTSDALRYFDRIVPPLAPSKIVIYEGSNDLASGKTPEKVLGDFKVLLDKIFKALPQARVYIISERPSKSRAAIRPEEDRLNAMLKELTTTDKRLNFIDVTPVLVDSEGKAKVELLKTDGLHLNDQGNALICEIIKKRLMED